MFAALAILTTAAALIAVQPLLLRQWPWLDARNRPQPSLWDALHAAATALPPLPPPGEAFVPSALGPGPEYSTVRPVVTQYDPLGDTYIVQEGARRVGVSAARVHLLNGLSARQRLDLQAAVADGHTQTAKLLEARSLEYRVREADLDLQRQLGAMRVEYDRQADTAPRTVVAKGRGLDVDR
jgi:hypothetical protein